MIAANLSGRTDNEIKNYWHTHLKKRTTHKTTTTTSQTEDQSCESSQCDQITSHCNGETEAESSNWDNNYVELSPPSLESSQSPAETSPNCIESSGLINRTSDLSDTHYSSNQVEAFYEEYYTGSDFWTKPFLEDTSEINNHDFPYPTCFGDGGTSLSYLSFYDDSMEYISYQ